MVEKLTFTAWDESNETSKVSEGIISKAIDEDRVLLIWCRGHWENRAKLYIYSNSKGAARAEELLNARYEDYCMDDEIWTERPVVQRALKVASGHFKIS